MSQVNQKITEVELGSSLVISTSVSRNRSGAEVRTWEQRALGKVIEVAALPVLHFSKSMLIQLVKFTFKKMTRLKKKKKVCLCISECHMCVAAFGGQKRVPWSWSHPVCRMGTELRSRERIASALNC